MEILMKKIVLACLAIVNILTYMMVINFYQSRDYDQIAKMGETSDSFQIYLQDSSVNPDSQISFFKELSRKYDISVILTTREQNNVVEKSVIASPTSFPAASFRLDKVDLQNDQDFYASFKTNSAKQKGKIPVFVKGNKIVLQSMTRYFKNKKTVDGVYTIIPGKSNRKELLKQFSQFYGVSRDQLLKQTIGRKQVYFTREIWVLSFIFVLASLVFILVNVYYPISQSSSIGIKKMNGWKNKDIFLAMIKQGIIIIVVTSIIINLTTLLIFSYRPNGFILTCILVQALILFLYLLANSVTYLIIKRISIGDLLKGKFHFGYGISLALIIKILMTVVSTFLLINMSTEISEAVASYQLQQEWAKEGKLKTVNSVGPVFITDEKETTKTMAAWFSKMAQNKGVYYVESGSYSTKNVLPKNEANKKPEQKYDLMSVNRNFIRAKLPELKRYLDATQHAFLVPSKYQKHPQEIKYFLQNYSYNNLSSAQQGKINPQQLKIKIKYYHEDVQPITYNVRLKKSFTNPIIEVVEDHNLTFWQSIALSNTDKTSPIKIEDNPQTSELLKKTSKEPQVKRLQMKFVSLNQILATSSDSAYKGLQVVIVVLLIIFVINLFATIFLLLYVISNQQKKLSVLRLLGYRKFDRYRAETLILLGLGLGEVITLICFKASLIPILLAVLMMLADLLVFSLVVQHVEARDLSFLLKGGLS